MSGREGHPPVPLADRSGSKPSQAIGAPYLGAAAPGPLFRLREFQARTAEAAAWMADFNASADRLGHMLAALRGWSR